MKQYFEKQEYGVCQGEQVKSCIFHDGPFVKNGRMSLMRLTNSEVSAYTDDYEFVKYVNENIPVFRLKQGGE